MRDTLDQRKAAVQRISIIGAIVNAVLSALKIFGGLLTGSAALIADGLHSLSDLATDVMVVFLLGISHKKPDKEHPWGHGRFETLGTVFLAIILLTVAGFMTWDSLKLLFAGEIPSPPAWPALVIAAISILANEVLFFYTLKVGKANHSNLIIANAWHHRTDSLSSIVVLIAIAGAMLGVWWLDALAAVLVALLIGKIGIDLLLKSLAELVDTGLPQERVNQLRETALAVDGVTDVHHFRTRMMGGQGLLEMHLQVPAHMSASEGHFIGDSVCAKLKDRFDDIGYIIYHIDTYDDELTPDAMHPLMPPRNEVQNHLNAAISRQLGDCPDYELSIYYAPKFIELEIKFYPEIYPLLEYTGLAAQSLETNLQQDLQSLNWFRNIRIWLPVNDSQV